MTFNWRSYIDALSANVQRVYSKGGGCSRWSGPPAMTGWALEKREHLLRPHVFFSQLNGSVSTYFPAADPQEELQNIALLLLLKLLDVCSVISSVACSEESIGDWADNFEIVGRTLKGTHGYCKFRRTKGQRNLPDGNQDRECLQRATYQNLRVGVDLGVNWATLVAVG